MLAMLSIVHPLVDACSMCVLLAGGMSWERVLAYNFIAFALQLPLGVALDARPRFARGCFACGAGLVCAATLAAATGAGGWTLLACVCLGNALFHLSAGKRVLDSHGGMSGPIGIFVSTGAIGLAAGTLGMQRCAAFAMPAFAVALAACAAAALRTWGAGQVCGKAVERPDLRLAGTAVLVIAGLFALVAWRGWVGLEAGRVSAARGGAMMLAGVVAALGGKAVGGCVADRLGRWPVVAAGVCGSAALAWLCPPESVLAWTILVFAAQLATGPVLSLLHESLGRQGGTAFGLNCLGLFAGSL